MRSKHSTSSDHLEHSDSLDHLLRQKTHRSNLRVSASTATVHANTSASVRSGAGTGLFATTAAHTLQQHPRCNTTSPITVGPEPRMPILLSGAVDRTQVPLAPRVQRPMPAPLPFAGIPLLPLGAIAPSGPPAPLAPRARDAISHFSVRQSAATTSSTAAIAQTTHKNNITSRTTKLSHF